MSIPIYSLFVKAQSSGTLTTSGQVNKLIFDSVAQSPAFISRSQFVEAWTASLPYLPIPNNVTFLNPMEYPLFMNTAVMVGNINNATQLAMYFAQILYETNGLSITSSVPCSRFGNQQACQEYNSINVNNTNAYQGANGTTFQYYGRGKLFIQNVGTYTDASQALYGNDILYKHPFSLNLRPNVAWATSAWNWATSVGSVIGNSDAFGLTTKFLRPGDCSKGQSSDNANIAFNIYQQVLSVFDPDRVANPSGCV